jgi:hypothetical protein
VPKLIATQVLKLAHRLDSGEIFDLRIESKTAKNDAISQVRLALRDRN